MILAVIGLCILGAIIIEARSHYLINKAMHSRVAALMGYGYGDNANKTDSKQYPETKHRALHLPEGNS